MTSAKGRSAFGGKIQIAYFATPFGGWWLRSRNYFREETRRKKKFKAQKPGPKVTK